jgi:CheY-like chemotaxis protein
MISHDVRTPLAGIIGVFDSLERAPLDAGNRRLVALGQRAGGILQTLITDILDVARVDSGRIRLEPAPFDPAQSLNDVVELNRPAAVAQKLRIAGKGAELLPARVIGDRARFEQLLGNLVSNAIAYTGAGEIIVAAHWEAGQPLPLVVEVIDTGPGIDPALVPTLFDAFVLAPRPGSRSAGLGLGLHISRSLAELMQGRIDYRPGDAGGSVFRVALPLPPAAAALRADDAAALPEAPCQVLLVEDDVIAGEVTRALLQSHGHDVVMAASADAAVALAAAHSFDVVLMDVQLGGGSDGDSGLETGLDATRRIRRLPGRHGRVTIIALTSDGMDACRLACRAAGMDGVMIKPFAARGGLARAIAAARQA